MKIRHLNFNLMIADLAGDVVDAVMSLATNLENKTNFFIFHIFSCSRVKYISVDVAKNDTVFKNRKETNLILDGTTLRRGERTFTSGSPISV